MKELVNLIQALKKRNEKETTKIIPGRRVAVLACTYLADMENQTKLNNEALKQILDVKQN